MNLFCFFLFVLVLVIILVKFGMDELKIFSNIIGLIFENENAKQENAVEKAEYWQMKLDDLNLSSDMKKLILKESQDNFNYSVELRRAENSRLLAVSAIVVSMIAAFYTLLHHINLLKEPWALALAVLVALVFGVGCVVAIIFLFKAVSCVYMTPPSTIDKIKELEKIVEKQKKGIICDFENSLSASNASISFENVQSNIKKAEHLDKAVSSIKCAFIGLALFAFELASLYFFSHFS